MACAGSTLDLAPQVGCGPTAIKVPRLRDNRHIANVARAHQTRVECDMARNRGKALCGGIIAPCGALCDFATLRHDVPIPRSTFPFAKGCAHSGTQLRCYARWWKIVGRSVMRLQNPPAGIRFSDQLTAKNNPHHLWHRLKRWRARIVLHCFDRQFHVVKVDRVSAPSTACVTKY